MIFFPFMFPRNCVYDVPNRDRLHIFENSVTSLSLCHPFGVTGKSEAVCPGLTSSVTFLMRSCHSRALYAGNSVKTSRSHFRAPLWRLCAKCTVAASVWRMQVHSLVKILSVPSLGCLFCLETYSEDKQWLLNAFAYLRKDAVSSHYQKCTLIPFCPPQQYVSLWHRISSCLSGSQRVSRTVLISQQQVIWNEMGGSDVSGSCLS